MARDSERHADPDETEIPTLVERYEAQRQALAAQAEALTRLREEVGAAAEREAQAVVARARRAIQTAVDEAQRELGALASQVQTSLGASGTDLSSEPWFEGARQAAVQTAVVRARATLDGLASEASDRLAIDRPAPARERSTDWTEAPPQAGPPNGPRDGASVRGIPWQPDPELVPAAATPSRPNRRDWLVRGGLAAAAVGVVLAALSFWSASPVQEPSLQTPSPDAAAGNALSGAPIIEEVLFEPPPAAAPGMAAAPPDTTQVDPSPVREAFASSPAPVAPAALASAPSAAPIASAPTAVPVPSPPAVAATAPPVVFASPPALDIPRTANTATASPALAPSAADAAAMSPATGMPAALESAAPLASAGVPEPVPSLGASPIAPALTADVEFSVPPAPGLQTGDAGIAHEAAAPTTPEINVISAGREWLEAYYQRDARALAAAALTSGEPTVQDERLPHEQFPPGTAQVQRRMETLAVDIAGDTAIVTGRIVEQRAGAPPSEDRVSRVAQIWVRRGGRWQLTDVRIVSEGRVEQFLRK